MRTVYFLLKADGHNFWPGLGVSWVVLIFGSRYYLIQTVWQRLGEHGAPAFHRHLYQYQCLALWYGNRPLSLSVL
jgi:hypothetical protein